MATRQPGLPEGTDHIIDTNIDLGGGDPGAGGTAGGGGSPTGGGTPSADTPASTGTAFKFDKDEADRGGTSTNGIMGQVKDQISNLTSQAGDKARSYADEGKGKATDLLQTLASIVADATGSVEERLGGQYAGAGRKASDAIQSLASTLDERSVDDLVADARAFVQRSPAVAIGIAAILGFAMARVVRSSVSEYRGGDTGSSGSNGNGPAA